MRYRQRYDGEWFPVRRRGWRMACCDCGLCHVVNFRVRNGELQMQVFTDRRATARRRRRLNPAKGKAGPE
jgi:hypothetical protein